MFHTVLFNFHNCNFENYYHTVNLTHWCGWWTVPQLTPVHHLNSWWFMVDWTHTNVEKNITYSWLSAGLQPLQCISNGVAEVLRWAIDTKWTELKNITEYYLTMMCIRISAVFKSGPSGLTSPSFMCDSYRFMAMKREWSGRAGVGEGGSRWGCGVSTANPLEMPQSWDARVAFSFYSLFSTLSLLWS